MPLLIRLLLMYKENHKKDIFSRINFPEARKVKTHTTDKTNLEYFIGFSEREKKLPENTTYPFTKNPLYIHFIEQIQST